MTIDLKAAPQKEIYNDAIGLVVRGILCYEPQTIFWETGLSCCQIIDIWAKTAESKARVTLKYKLKQVINRRKTKKIETKAMF